MERKQNQEERSAAESGGVERWVLNPNFRFVPVTDDEVLFLHGLRSVLNVNLHDEHGHGILAAVLRRFEQPARLEDVLRDFGDHRGDVEPVLRQLRDVEILVPPEQDVVSSFLGVRVGRASDLSRRRAAVLGAGPLGARVAAGLARHRVGEVVLVDSRAAPSAEELRPYLPFPLGRDATGPLADVVRANAQAADPGARLASRAARLHRAEEVRVAAADADIWVLAADRYQPSAFRAVNEASLAAGKPLLIVMADAAQAMLGPMFVPPRTACYVCFESHYEAALVGHPIHLAYKRAMGIAEHDGSFPAPSIPSILDVAGGLGTFHALDFLLRGVSPLENRVCFLDFERFINDAQDVLRLPRCPACRPRPTEVSPA